MHHGTVQVLAMGLDGGEKYKEGILYVMVCL